MHDGRRFTQQDLLVPWSDQKTGEYVLRYYHLFDRGELEYIILNCGLSCTIEAVTYDQGNWIAVFQKS